MRKGTDLIGKPIVSFDTGERIEHIRDLISDQTKNQLLGFVVDEGGWFSTARVLPLSHIHAIGPDTIIVRSKDAIVPADSDLVIQRILERNNVLKGTTIVTTDGQDLGTLVDLYFDDQTGIIEGYEASGGVFADAFSGRSFVPARQTLKIGEDVAFVPPETAQLMEEQVGGPKGATQRAAETLGATATNTDADPEQQVDQAAGRRVTELVSTDQGLIIAAPGQIVTEQVINRARTYHLESDLLAAVGRTATDRTAGAAISTAANTASDSVVAGAQNVQAGAANLWERIKKKVSETQESVTSEQEEQRIIRAVGRPTTRVILDPQDTVILNVGELITYEALRRAREAGVLEVLLTSVYEKDPELSQEEQRAPEPGEASLEQQHGKHNLHP
jgi:uncharacterized protein YrrD